MTYDEAIEWLLSFADFERSGRFQDRPDVAPMLALLERLGNPHLGRTTVHIAGSKGKGSVAAIVTATLGAAGISTAGLYTSPHLYSYCERIQRRCLSWQDLIAEDEFANIVETRVRPGVETIQVEIGERRLVTFDLLTALGFVAFHGTPEQAPVDAQVIEVGLGGRVDSTNVFNWKEIVVITPISLEHTEILGDTIEQIAAEKAAIITRKSAVVMAPQPDKAAERVVRETTASVEPPLIGPHLVDVAQEYAWRRLSHDHRGQRIAIEGPRGTVTAQLPLLGSHQIENAATALACIDAIVSGGAWNLTREDEEFIEGLASVRWPCRIEVLREDPLVIADGAHNRDSARRLAETLVEYFACDRALFVIGCGSDKDVEGLAEELAPLASRVLAVRSEHPRAMAPERIAEAFGRLRADVEIAENVPAAVDSAIAAAGAGALICVAGSLFVAAEARAHVLGLKTAL